MYEVPPTGGSAIKLLEGPRGEYRSVSHAMATPAERRRKGVCNCERGLPKRPRLIDEARVVQEPNMLRTMPTYVVLLWRHKHMPLADSQKPALMNKKLTY